MTFEELREREREEIRFELRAKPGSQSGSLSLLSSASSSSTTGDVVVAFVDKVVLLPMLCAVFLDDDEDGEAGDGHYANKDWWPESEEGAAHVDG